MEPPNLGICNNCGKRVKSEFVPKDGQLFIQKDCPDCGLTESLVSTDAKAWQAKRELWPYASLERQACPL